MPDPLLIRADGSARMGLGHLMRCLALGETWRRAGGEVILLSADLPLSMGERLRALDVRHIPLQAEPGGSEDSAELIREARAASAECVMLDGYQFDGVYQRRIKDAGLRLCAVDDFGHAGEYSADWVLNQTAGADPSLYARRAPSTQLLLGSRYVLLRRQFQRWRRWGRPVPVRAQSLLVTFGGSDPGNMTARVLEALPEGHGLALTVVLGPGNPRKAEYEAIASRSAGLRVLSDPPDLPALMAEADLAIGAGGTTAWEAAFMGLPYLLVTVADNQRVNAAVLHAGGIAQSVGWHADLTPQSLRQAIVDLAGDAVAREAMSRKGRQWVDGLGTTRAWLRMHRHTIELRPVTLDDARRIFDWANEPSVRAVSFNQDPIPWEGHLKWLSARLADPQCLFWTAWDRSGCPVGQIRFDCASEGAAVISVMVDARFRGRNLGPLLIDAGCRKLFAECPVGAVDAFIRCDNPASREAFEKADFMLRTTEAVRGHAAWVLRRERTDA